MNLLMFYESSAFSLILFSNLQRKMQHNFYKKKFINSKSELEIINSYNREDEKSIRFLNMLKKTMLMVKYFKWKTLSQGLKIWDPWKTARKNIQYVYLHMCAIKKLQTCFFYLFSLFFIYMLYLKLSCSPSANKSYSSFLSISFFSSILSQM